MADQPLDLSLFGDAHVAAYRESDGATGHMWNGALCCILTTSRRNGDPREVALIYGTDGDDVILVASKGGAPDHPWWYKDLAARPAVEMQVLADRYSATARTASADEKERLWPTMTAVWPAYDDYQASTDRDIPVVIVSRS